MLIRIQNFQRHVDTTLDIQPGVTSLVGRSDHGKTSVWRAINWFKFDRPLGLSFIRKGQIKTSVSIDDVEHIRTKTKNYYVDSNGEPIDPKKAQALINIDTVNLQEQHDPPFLLKDSPGEVARKLALLIDLTKPQNILRDLKSQGSKLTSKRNGLISLQNNLEEELSQYALLIKFKRGMTRIESTLASIEKQRQAMATLAGAIENATQAQLRLSTMPNTKAYEATITGLIKQVEEASRRHKEIEMVRTTINSVLEKEKMRMPDHSALREKGELLLDNVSKQIAVIKTINYVEVHLKQIRKFTLCLSKSLSAVGTLPHLEGYLQKIHNTKTLEKALTDLRSTRNELSTVTKEFNEKQHALDELRASIDICPFCGR